MDYSKLFTDSFVGKVFNSSRLSLTVLGVLITAGVIGTAPVGVPLIAMWIGIGAYVASETAVKLKKGNGGDEAPAPVTETKETPQ